MTKLEKSLIVAVSFLIILLFIVVTRNVTPKLKNGEENIVTLKEGNITANDLYEITKTKSGAQIITDEIDMLILNEMYEADDEEKEYLQDQIDSIKESAEQNSVTYQYLINYYGYEDEASFKEALTLNYRREKAINDYLTKQLSEEDINNYYENNIFGDIEAKHILIKVETNDDMSEDEITEAENDAKEIAEEVINKFEDGEDWDTLAKDYSGDTSNADEGGDLGWITTGEMVSEFEDAAFALEKDSYTKEPVKTQYGYHIIYKTDEKEKPSLEDSMDTIEEKMVASILEEDPTAAIEALVQIRKDSELVIIDSELKTLYNNLISQQKESLTSE